MTIGNKTGPKAYVALYDATTGNWKSVSSAAQLPWPASRCGGACFLAGSLSCVTSKQCMTSGLGGFFLWNGSKFTPTHPVSAGPKSKLNRVSCVKAFCVAVGYRTVNGARRPLTELWNGKTWKVLPSPG